MSTANASVVVIELPVIVGASSLVSIPDVDLFELLPEPPGRLARRNGLAGRSERTAHAGPRVHLTGIGVQRLDVTCARMTLNSVAVVGR
jgi:hypothetical protein